VSSKEDGWQLNRARLLKRCLAVAFAGGLVALCIWVTVQKPSLSTGAETSSTPSPVPTVAGEEDALEKPKNISKLPQPTDDEIWAFETAYVTADPTEQRKLLEKVATPQYISNEYSTTSINVDGLEVKVDRTTSSFSIQRDSENTHCFITSTLNLNSFRNKELVLTYSIQHTTIWVNTRDGWRVATEVR